MPQTMLALLALMLVGLYAWTEQSRNTYVQKRMIYNEMATMATGVALRHLDRIGAKAFDDETVDQTLTSASQLTTPEDFGIYGAQNNAINDFHQKSAVETIDLDGNVLQFKIYTTVTYADESDPNQPAASGQKTKYKRVRASVHSLTVPLPDSIYVYRSFGCGSRCDW